MTDDLDDPFVQDLIEEFGGDGYLVYFGTISLICRQQNKENLSGKFEFSVSFLRKKFQVSAKKLAKIYQFSETFSKLSCRFSEKKVSVSIPKIIDIVDDWSKRLRSNSVVTPKILSHEVRSKKEEVEVEVEVDKKKKNIKKKKKTDAVASSPPKNLFAKKIFEHWNLKPNLVEHREFEKFRPPIEARLKAGYTAGELCQAMDNLDFIIGSDQHFWNYSGWTLEQFLSQKNSLDRFMDRNNPRVKFLKNTPEDEEERKIREWANS